ncbi:membrane protein insertion efficiency factor YidD [Methylacidimicrobium sp. B4]|uniref:membrane protein insertion efficiency factor YidD n=1 Tax=Methylacidimicrobium sp. B4 TaxID=2796139 RepID=UPI001A90272E|nr:membrane protein insertion efficiency factor YidD [Methylacidimicrobium sp. B4]QSR84468.1 membrane protein insertion efficiency factor YidD [Methylacidimicrobium sp. B4]
MKRGIHWVLAIYRGVLTPLRQTFGLYGCCRHVPTCSEYCRQAVERHGYGAGLLLSLRRILRCHPWGTSGWDPVPGCERTLPRTERCGTGAEEALPAAPREGDRIVALPAAGSELPERMGRETREAR